MEETSKKVRFYESGKSVTLMLVTFSFFVLFTARVQAIDPLTHSKFSEVVNQVSVLKANGPKKHPQVGDLFQVPELLQTGSRSRAELIAEDNTITRVGANTVFSFVSAKRTLRLQRGSLLFHSPKGRGGGTIQTASASAAVLGTTIIVIATDDGGFKFLVLEGQGEVRLHNGFRQLVNAGELVFIAPHSEKISKPLPYNLKQQIENSSLVQGFSQPLLSLNRINQAIDYQQKKFPYLNSFFLADIWKQRKETALIDANAFVQFSELNQAQAKQPAKMGSLPESRIPTAKNPTRPTPPTPG